MLDMRINILQKVLKLIISNLISHCIKSINFGINSGLVIFLPEYREVNISFWVLLKVF